MALQGTLKDFGLADIFQLIGMQRKTGVLTLRRGKETVTVSFLNGSVVSADAMNRRLEQRLGALLVKNGRITEEQLQDALKIQSQTLQPLGIVLTAQKMITMEHLKRVLQVQVTQIVYSLYRWKDGEYHFSQEETVDFEEEIFTPVSAETLLMEGARMIDEWPFIEKRIPSYDLLFRPVEGASVAGAEGELYEEDQKVLAMVDGKNTVQDIIDRLHLGDFETCRILYELLNRNLIESGGGVAPRETRRPRRKLPIAPAILGLSAAALVVAAVIHIPANPLSPVGVFGVIHPDELRLPASRNRLSRIDNALRVYYLHRQSLPGDLSSLATEGYIDPSELVDPWGNPYGYDLDRAGYRLTGTGPHGEPQPDLSVTNLFPPSRRLVLEGVGDTTAALLDPAGSAWRAP